MSGLAVQWATAALAMLASGLTDQAIDLAWKVWKEAPDCAEATTLASEVLSAKVPNWHFRLVRDHVRNAAFDAALRRHIRPGMRVLDIGSGTGLLAMMAARAGAAEIISCEANRAVANAAREIVNTNGFAQTIRVVAEHSTKLDLHSGLGGRVDLIVSEILGNDMLSEGALESMEHAVENFLKPGGRVIPAMGTVRIALAFDRNWSDTRMGLTERFDLSCFNRLARPRYYLPTTDTRLELRSQPENLFEFNFQSAVKTPDARTQRALIAHGGPVNCVAQWLHLRMDEEGTYENDPEDHNYSNWDIVVYPMPTQIQTEAGEQIVVNASHDRTRVRVWVDLPARQ